MNIEFHPEAAIELNEAVDYYASRENRLGLDFISEVISSINRIISYPDAWPLLGKDIRRCLIKRYPYGILYSIEKERISIVAIMNLNRNPEYWKKRI